MNVFEKPKVTVLISTYNRPQYLAEAIESVVNQRYENWELIVLNDGGVDVAEVVEKFADPRIIYVPDDENKGAARRFNQGLALARGEYVTYLGDDDIFYPNHIEVLAGALDANPDIALAYSDLYAASSISDRQSGKRYVLDRRIVVSRNFNREFMFHFNHVLHVSLMHRLSAAKRVGGFDESVKVLIEWSLNRRLVFLYDFLHVNEVTGEYHMPVLKSDRISVRERRNSESYKHNLRRIRTNFPAEPWPKIKRIDLLYVVDEWGEKLNQHLKEIIDNFDHPFRIFLINNGTGRTLKQIKSSLGELNELKSINIFNITSKQSPLMACRMAAKKSNAEYLFLVAPNLEAVKCPKRLFSTMEFFKDHPEHKAVRWEVAEEKGSLLNLIIEKQYFMKCSRPGRDHVVNIQSISLKAPKGFMFDSLFTRFKQALGEKKYQEALEIMERIMREKEGVPPIQYLIHYYSPLCMRLKKYEPLEKTLRDLVDRGYRADNLIRLGYLLGFMGRWPEAVDTFKQALTANGLNDEDFSASCFPLAVRRNLLIFQLLIGLGEACLEVNDPAQAAHYYHLASRVRLKNHKSFLGFARVWMANGLLDKAEEALQAMPKEESKDDPEVHRILGQLCQKKKDLPLAFQCYQKVFELCPEDEKNIDPFYFVGTSLRRWEEMYAPLAAFTELKPDNAQGWARLSSVCFQNENDEMALKAAEKCLDIEPNNAVAKSILGRVEAKMAREGRSKPSGQDMVVEIGGLTLDLDSSPISW